MNRESHVYLLQCDLASKECQPYPWLCYSRLYSKTVASRLGIAILPLYLALQDDVLSDLRPVGSVYFGAPEYKRDVGILE